MSTNAVTNVSRDRIEATTISRNFKKQRFSRHGMLIK